MAPNIREKRKVENRFIKYSKAELIVQIKNFLRPETDVEENIDQLLLKTLVKNPPSNDEHPESNTNDEIPEGSDAVFEGPLGERKVGVVIDPSTLQMYRMTRYGFEPEDITEDISNWRVIRIVEDYDFVKRRTGVYLVCLIENKEMS